MLDTDKEEHVRKHDLVRHVSVQIASQGEHVFLVKTGMELQEWPSYEAFTIAGLEIVRAARKGFKLLLLSTNWHRRTQDDEQKRLSRKEQVVEEEETKCSSCLFDQCQIEQDIPQDSAQDGKEHLDQDTDNRENSGEVIQESHYNEPENLQKASEEIVEETSLSLYPSDILNLNFLQPPAFAEAMRIYEVAKSKRSSGRASDRKRLSELLNMKAGDLVDAQEFEELQDLLAKVNSVGKDGLPIEAQVDVADIANSVKFYGRSMLGIGKKKSEVAKQV
ncbi:hypothetical protein Peur_060567 [Populus x canadensis]